MRILLNEIMATNVPPVNVIQAKLGNSAGMIGAAFMNEFLKDDDNE